jgi:hypothetical protein
MKNLTNIFQALLFILLSVNILSSQITASVYVTDFDNEILTTVINRNSSSIDKNKFALTSAKYYDISDVDLSTTIDVASNELDFSGGDNKNYTKIQLTHKNSNKTVLSREIDFNYKIDLNTIVPGTYILMLSNEKGNLKSEEITVF